MLCDLDPSKNNKTKNKEQTANILAAKRTTLWWSVKKKKCSRSVSFLYRKKKRKKVRLSWRKPTVRCAMPPEPASLSTKVGSVPVASTFSSTPRHSTSAPSWSPSAPLGLRGWRFGAEPFNVLCAAGEVGVGKVGGVGFYVKVTVG